MASKTKYWILVEHRTQVEAAAAGGFIKLIQSKNTSLKKLNMCDWVICYSPKADVSCPKPLRMFTAIAQVTADLSDEESQKFQANYLICREASIEPLLHKLSFIRDPERWGYVFRSNLFEIAKEDFQTISRSMKSPKAPRTTAALPLNSTF